MPEFISKLAIIRSTFYIFSESAKCFYWLTVTQEKSRVGMTHLSAQETSSSINMQMAQPGRTKENNNKIAPKPQILRR